MNEETPLGRGPEIQRRLPHRPPYLFLDRIRAVSSSEWVADGRAPGHAALLVELAAQAAAAGQGGDADLHGVVMVGVLRFRILRSPAPGEALHVLVRKRGAAGGQMLFGCELTDASDAVVAAGDLALARSRDA